VKFGDENDFDTAFKHLWPKKGHILKSRVQNYPCCKYYVQWKRLIASAGKPLAHAMRMAIRKRFNKLVWIPRAHQERMWSTAQLNGFTRLPLGLSGPAPQILVRAPVRWEGNLNIDI
jgi:hypothetical protein